MNTLRCFGPSTKKAFDLVLTAILLVVVTACDKKIEPEPVRPVRSMVVQAHEVGEPVVLTGQVRARDEVRLAFRLSGKLIARPVTVGDTVVANQTIARLDSEIERNALKAAEAEYAAAEAALEQAVAAEKRLRQLSAEKAVSHAEYEGALRQLKTAQAQIQAVKAKENSAREQVGYTELKAESGGVITAKGAEPGEVVRAGDMIAILARQDRRDAIFDMPAPIIRDGLMKDQEVEVWLADTPEIRAIGQIREIAPQADPSTRTHQVKASLDSPPGGMFLGATIAGRFILQTGATMEIPASALASDKNEPAVWVIDQPSKTVHKRTIAISRYTQDGCIVTSGLQSGETIVTAGAHALYEGQNIRLLESGHDGR